MKLYTQLERTGGPQAQAIAKHLKAIGVNDWQDLTKARIMDFRDEIKNKLAPSSAKTVGAALAAFLHRYEDEGLFPCTNFAEVLRLKGEKSVKTFLTPQEVERLERVELKNEIERYVLNEFLVGCKTGARVSDVGQFSLENIDNGQLTYTSIKTGITATIPVSTTTAERIKYLNDHPMHLWPAQYIRIIRRLCERAGITEQVKVHKGGKDKVGPKYKFISSHSARVSVCTNLANMNVPVLDIMQIAGHTDPAMTARYIVRTQPKLNDKAMNYLSK